MNKNKNNDKQNINLDMDTNIDIDKEKDTIRDVLGCTNENNNETNVENKNETEKSLFGFSFKKREEEIKKSLEPTKEYENMSGTKNVFAERKETTHKIKENRKLNIILVCLIFLCLLACCFYFTCDYLVPQGRSLTKSQTITMETNQTSVNIDGVVISYIQNGNLFNISIDNKHNEKDNVYYNVNGTYLSSEDKMYSFYMEQTTNVTPYFFNKKITYNTYVEDKIFFNSSSTQKAKYLVLTDVLVGKYSYDIVFTFK